VTENGRDDTMKVKRTPDEWLLDSLTLQRHATDLGQIADSLLARARELQRAAQAARERAERARKAMREPRRR
jgi:hypothetical protein